MESQPLAKKIFLSFRQMLAGKGVNTFLTIISGYFNALILGPAIYGVWQTARVFISYGSFINLGMPFVIRRDYPALKKEGKTEEAERIIRQGISFGVVSFPLAALIVLSIALIFDSDLNFKRSLITVALWFVVIIPAGIGTIINKAANDYKTVGIAEAIYGIGNLCMVPFIYWYGLPALLIGYIITTIVQSYYYFINRPVKYGWFWDSKLLKSMILTAFPLFLVHVAASVFASIDRLIIAGMLDFKSVGLYSLSTFIASPISLFVSSFSIVLFTQLNERYGRSKEPHVIEKHVFIPQQIFSYLLPPVIGVGIIILPVFTNVFLPKYTGGIAAAQINIFAVFFYMLAGFSANALFVMDKQKLSAYSFLIAGAIKSVGSMSAIKAGYGIEGVAAFSFLGYFAYNSLMLYFINSNLGYNWRAFFGKMIHSLLCPAVILTFSLAYIAWADVIFEYLKIHNPWLQTLFGLFLIIIVGAWFFNKALTMLKNLVKSKAY